VSQARAYPRRLVLTSAAAFAALAITGTALAGPTPSVRISDLTPANGSTVTVGQEVVVSGFVETDDGIGIVGDKPNVTVLIDGVAAAPEFVVGSKALNVGFRVNRAFAAGEHTVAVTARDYKGVSASAETKFTAGVAVTQKIRVGDLVPANGSTVAVSQDVVVSAFIETEDGIGVVNEKADVTVLVDGVAITPEIMVGSKALNAGFQITRQFTAGSHTLSVTARDSKGQSATAQTMFAASAENCQVVNGFAKLQSQISDITGRCLTNEFTDKLTGDTLQMTTGPDGNGGMFVYRKSDNHVAYTDGYRTWLLGPRGSVEWPRLNTERYGWEKERLTPKMLREGKYQLPIGQNDAEVTFKLVDGKAAFANPRWPEMPNATVTLANSSVWYGDFDGDSYRDAVVVLAVALGGSGEDVYAVPVRDVNGQAVQLGHELLGNRVKINGITLGTGVFRADIYTQGPNDVASNPTVRETKTFAVKLP